MRRKVSSIWVASLLALTLGRETILAQDLAPRAYFITPVGSNAITLGFSFNDGMAFVDPTIPIENLHVQFQTQTIGYYNSFALMGRSANVTVVLPYVTATLTGTVAGDNAQINRSGLADGRVRFAVNLRGGPALSPKEYLSWHEKNTIGISLTAMVPTGQYDSARLVNNGANRWALKPEVGFSNRWGRWMLDIYAGVWFFTPNHDFYPGGRLRKEAVVASGEAHFGRYVTPRLWASLDANFWNGGQSNVNGVPNQDRERNSRIGASVSVPMGRHQAVKFSYSRGAYVQVGGDYTTVSAAWQYSWVGKIE
jgi:hypothetical protein